MRRESRVCIDALLTAVVEPEAVRAVFAAEKESLSSKEKRDKRSFLRKEITKKVGEDCAGEAYGGSRERYAELHGAFLAANETEKRERAARYMQAGREENQLNSS